MVLDREGRRAVWTIDAASGEWHAMRRCEMFLDEVLPDIENRIPEGESEVCDELLAALGHVHRDGRFNVNSPGFMEAVWQVRHVHTRHFARLFDAIECADARYLALRGLVQEQERMLVDGEQLIRQLRQELAAARRRHPQTPNGKSWWYQQTPISKEEADRFRREARSGVPPLARIASADPSAPATEVAPLRTGSNRPPDTLADRLRELFEPL